MEVLTVACWWRTRWWRHAGGGMLEVLAGVGMLVEVLAGGMLEVLAGGGMLMEDSLVEAGRLRYSLVEACWCRYSLACWR